MLAAAWSRCCLGAGDELGTGYFGCLLVGVGGGFFGWVRCLVCGVLGRVDEIEGGGMGS